MSGISNALLSLEEGGYWFRVRIGEPKDLEATSRGTKLARGSNFKCLMSDTPISSKYLRGEFQAGRSGKVLMAVVLDGDHGRVYLSSTKEMESIAESANPEWKPEAEMNQDTPNLVSGRGYGFKYWHELFTPRQLVALTTFSDLVKEAQEKVREDFNSQNMTPPPNPLPLSGEGEQSTSKEESKSLRPEPFSPSPVRKRGPGGKVAFPEEESKSLRPEPFSPLLSGGGAGGGVYSEAISIYLALTVSRCSAHWSGICTWDGSRESVRTTFARQAIPMTWDFAETNPMSSSSGNFISMLDWVCKAVRSVPAKEQGNATQSSAESQSISFGKVVSTDPPYYDNIGYADLSDFFYIWLRKSLKSSYPSLFSTMVIPKAQELISAPHRHGSKEKAEAFFLEGMSKAIQNLAEQVHPAFPVTIYYAFKQTENKDTEGKVNTGWDTFLSAIVKAGFAITGTWPIRTELSNRSNGLGTNALASSIVLVCRVRPKEARTVSNLRFLRALQSELPAAMIPLQQANMSPVDFAQAAIGPGMAVFSRNAKVIDAEEKEMSVREALTRIDECLGELFSEQNSTLDSESRWALTWFEQHGFETGLYGAAETLSKARNTSIEKLIGAGMVESHSGKVRLFPQEELNPDWFPTEKVTTWRATHQLIRRLSIHGEESTAKLFVQLGDSVGNVPILSYRLFTLCESMKMAKEAVLYNDLVQRWIDIEKLIPHVGESGNQGKLSIGESR
ncbi:putative DNA methylase [Gammaproteobacteria bacterium]